MPDETTKSFQFDKVLAIWHRRKWLAILSFAAAFSAIAAIGAFLPNIYQASATILVVGQQVPVEFVRPTVTDALDTRLQAISQEILSRSRLEKLIASFGLYPHLRKQLAPEALIERMRRDIEVKPKGVNRAGGTTAFTISYQGSDPQTLALVTNTLASDYIEENMKVRERQTTGTADFLKAQLEDVKKRLEEQERRASDFKRRHLGELPHQMEANLATLERLTTQFRLNSERQIRAREQRQELARLLDSMALLGAASGPAAAGAQPAPAQPDAMSARLSRLKQELTDLRTRFSDKYPDVLQLKAETASLEHQLAEARRERTPVESAPAENERAAPADPYVVQLQQTLSQLDVEIKALNEEEKNLRTAMATYQARVENTPRRDLEFQELSRDYDSTRELYRTLLKRYDEAQLAESLEQRQKGEQFRILEPAVPPSAPAAPKRLRLILLGLMLSLGLAAGVVALAEQLDTSFHTIDDLRAFTNVPVLLSIPRIVTKTDVSRSRWRAQLTAAAAVFGLMLIVGASYFVARGNEQLLRMLTPGRS